MTVNYESFAEFATELLSSTKEIDWRMSAGRAYYASFHRAKLSTKFCPDNSNFSMGSHTRVTDQFLKHGANQAKSIAYVLQAMKKIRHSADYELEGNWNLSNAVNQLAQHKVLIKRLEAFDSLESEKMA